MAFTEFYCDTSTGANINAGDLTANGVVTSTNGAWSTVTNIFTATGGTPFSGVSVGDFASLYLDGGTVSVYVARVTAVGGGGLTLTLSSTAKSGTAPTTVALGVSCTTGGAWKGPNAAEAFPFGFSAATMTNAAADKVRVNFKNTSTYSITAAMVHSLSGYVRWEGYTTTVADGGRANIDGGTAGASYVLLTIGGNSDGHLLKNLIFSNNGATGSASGVVITRTSGINAAAGCVFHGFRGHGLSTANAGILECEAYDCNQSNTLGLGGFTGATGATPAFVRCISHDNTGSNAHGFRSNGGSSTSIFTDCVADSNGGVGFNFPDTGIPTTLDGCNAYNNGSHGVVVNVSANFGYAVVIENCNFLKNGGFGIQFAVGTAFLVGGILNCGFGSGTQVNASGDINNSGPLEITGKITYASNVTPWIDPANGNFQINLAAAEYTGRGVYTTTAASYGPTQGYPDVGAAQHAPIGVAATFTS